LSARVPESQKLKMVG